MNVKIERRRAERRDSDEALSPEYLRLLEVCGGEIRATDRKMLAERRVVGAGPTVGAAPDNELPTRERRRAPS